MIEQVRSDADLLLAVVRPLVINGNEEGPGRKITVPGSKALEFIFSGDAVLHPKQDRPPNELLDAVEQQLRALDEMIGPECSTLGILEKFEKEALVDRKRCAFLRGQRLHWLEGGRILESAFENAFALSELTVAGLLAQLNECVELKLREARTLGSNRHLSDFEMVEEGIVCKKTRVRVIAYVSDRSQQVSRFIHYGIGPEWASFYVRQKNLRDLLSSALRECLETGRILTVEETASGAALFAPWQWKDHKLSRATLDNRYYLFSGDLPNRWFRTQRVLKNEERDRALHQVIEHAEGLYAIRRPSDRKLLRGEFVDLAVNNFGCTKRVAEEGWKSAEIPAWKRGGAPKGLTPKCLTKREK